MFAKTIIDSDVFLDMPLSTQALYFHLSMRADDDGFVNNPKKIQRMVGGSDDDMRILIVKKFIITFDSGVIVIKHWKMHNYIQSDRYKSTVYLEEKAMLEVSENKSYKVTGNQCIQDVSILDSQVRLGKDSIELGKDSIELLDEPSGSKPTKHKYGEYNNVLLTDEELEKLNNEFADLDQRIERLSEYIASKGTKYKSHYATIKSWARKETEQKPKEKGRLDWIDDIR